MQSKTKLVTVVKPWGKLTSMKAYISCLKITERGWSIPSYYNRDSKSTKKDHQIYFKKMQNIKIGSAFSSYWKHNSKRMKINHPSISTNKAINWYHNYLTLATHVSKRQRDKIRDRLEKDTEYHPVTKQILYILSIQETQPEVWHYTNTRN